jgi:glycosyltransferase involved in cell wall biosynthesis
MPPITALLFARNDGLRIGRALETLRFPAETIVVDQASSDRTAAVARQYGARVVSAAQLERTSTIPAANQWIFYLTPRESIGDDLEATLLEWCALPALQVSERVCFCVRVREEFDYGWVSQFHPETRLVPRKWNLRANGLPLPSPTAQLLPGALLRFSLP